MRDLPPPAPDFGAAVHTPTEAPFLTQIAHRRSASAQALQAPGPSADELDAILRLSARAPDHGKLFPWRFVVLEGKAKAGFAARLAELAERQADPDKARQALRKLTTPPLAVVVISRVEAGKIPEWEQVLSAGSVCTLMLLAAQGMGYGANWITDWYSYDAGAAAILGLQPHERVAGFVYIGTAAEAPLERVRPDVAALTTRWSDPQA
jgi:nitroreductase